MTFSIGMEPKKPEEIKDQSELTCIVISLNEEEYIERMLLSVRNLVDEIILVDSGSTDHTVKIAEQYGVKIFHKKFNYDYAEQRNYALDQVKTDWVLSLDCDEFLDPKLADWIGQKKYRSFYDGYSFNIHNLYYDSNPALPTKMCRLFNSKFRFFGSIHERVNAGNVRELDYGSIIHLKSMSRQKSRDQLYYRMDPFAYEEFETDKEMQNLVKKVGGQEKWRTDSWFNKESVYGRS